MLAVSVGCDAPPAFVEFTEVGGGATCSEGPKMRPSKLPTKDPLAEGDGGGGTTDLPGSGAAPGDRRRMSVLKSVDSGGATTAGEGKLSFELGTLARSGADTGGGTTAGSMVCTGAAES